MSLPENKVWKLRVLLNRWAVTQENPHPPSVQVHPILSKLTVPLCGSGRDR